MSDLVGEAHKRIQELELELEELRHFLEIAGRLTGTPAGTSRDAVRRVGRAPSGRSGDAKGSSPKEIVAGLFDILSESRETLERDVLIERLAERGIKVPGIYANKNLATILWRNQQLFDHVQGSGYKWTGAPLDTPRK